MYKPCFWLIEFRFLFVADAAGDGLSLLQARHSFFFLLPILESYVHSFVFGVCVCVCAQMTATEMMSNGAKGTRKKKYKFGERKFVTKL